MDGSDPRTALEALIEQSGEGFAALSRMIGRNDAYLQQFVRRGSPRRLAERDRKMLAGYLGVDEAVLGGPVRASQPPMVAVRRLVTAASAGPGALAEDDRTAGIARFDGQFLARLGVRAETISVLRAEGDSMRTLIEDGDEMLVDQADRSIGNRAAIFVLRVNGALIVKSLSREACDDGEVVRVASLNPTYADVLLRRDDEVDIVGRVVWLSRALR